MNLSPCILLQIVSHFKSHKYNLNYPVKMIDNAICGKYEPYDAADDDYMGKMRLGTREIYRITRDKLEECTVDSLSVALEKILLPCLDPNSLKDIIGSFMIFFEDNEDIYDDTIIDPEHNISKQSFLECRSFSFSTLMAALILYSYKIENNIGKGYKNKLDSVFYSRAKKQGQLLSLLDSKLGDIPQKINELLANSIDILSHAGAHCMNCHKPLTVASKFNGINSIVNIKGMDILLCPGCLSKLKLMDDAALNAMFLRITAEKEKEALKETLPIDIQDALLQELMDKLSEELEHEDLTGTVSLNMDALAIEKKLEKSALRKSVKMNVAVNSEAVNNVFASIDEKNVINSTLFRRYIKNCYETIVEKRPDSPPELVVDLLVDELVERTDLRYRSAAEVLIHNLIQTCEVFHEITK